jgi:hypothetical protein
MRKPEKASAKGPKTWNVEVPIAGAVWVQVRAETREEAIELGVQASGGFISGEHVKDIRKEHPAVVEGGLMELESYESLIDGAVLHAHCSRASADEVVDG